MDAKFEEAVASYSRESGGGGWLRQSEAVQMTYDGQIYVSEPPFVNYIMTVKGQQI